MTFSRAKNDFHAHFFVDFQNFSLAFFLTGKIEKYLKIFTGAFFHAKKNTDKDHVYIYLYTYPKIVTSIPIGLKIWCRIGVLEYDLQISHM